MTSRRRVKKRSSFRICLLFLFLIIFSVISIYLYKRYSFTKEKADLKQVIGVEGNDVAIYLNDNLVVSTEDVKNIAVKENSAVYVPLSFIKKYLNNRFYYAKDIERILYSLPEETRSIGIGDMHQVGNAPSLVFKDEPYLLIDVVKDYTNIRYDSFVDDENKRIYIYNDWDKEDIAYMKGKEAARVQGGNKSPIVTEIKKGEEVKILDKMTKWIKVKTANGYIGYIRKTKITNETEKIPISDHIEMSRKQNKMSVKPCIGFHQLFSIYNSSRLPEVLKNAKRMNVLAPTWYCIRNNDGDIRSIANDSYATYCNYRNIPIWATINNFDVEDIDEKVVFSSTSTRRKMIEKILREVSVYKLSGINLDIEQVSQSAGEDYMQFIRELSIELTKVGCILSVDTYVPYSYNKQYDLKEFNDFCDYVIIMAYDEHYSGSKVAGSVSSINFIKDAINLSLVEVDKEKLIIALPFYSRIWTTTPSGKVTSSAAGSSQIESSAIAQGLKFEFDEETCQNYGSKTTQDGNLVECWLEDDLSLAYKMSEIKKYDLAGTAGWKLTQERENFFNIINLNE